MAIKFTSAIVEVGIVTGDPERSLAFYRDFLGLTFLKEMRYPGGCQYRLAVGDSVLKLNFSEANKSPTLPAGGGPSGGVAGFRYISFPVANLDEIVREAEERGYKVAVPVRSISPTISYAFLEDPDGNWIELFHSAS